MLRSLVAFIRGNQWNRSNPTTIVVDDGAWCWFADPRVVRHCGTRDSIYVGSVTSEGDIRIDSYQLRTGRTESAILRKGLDRNDHANPSLLVDPEGLITVFYSAHNGPVIYSRTSAEPEDISEWRSESVLELNRGDHGRNAYTYPSPVSTSDGEVYLFWRGDGWKPTMSVSQDGGKSWSASRVVVAKEGAGDTNRPYMKVSGSDDFVDMAFTDGHPRNETFNSIYYARLQARRFQRADASSISSLGELPFEPSDADRVYDAEEHGSRSWIWDVASDRLGRPAMVFSVFPNDDEHYYWYARWSGNEWILNEIVKAGRWFPEDIAGRTQSEPHYSGGVVLDHEDIDVVYLSLQVNGIFEIERWTTTDLGFSWERSPVTNDSSFDNVRPVAIRNSTAGTPQVMWMEISGRYTGYKDYKTSIRMS